MSSKNKFGFDDLSPTEQQRPRIRSLGPMGQAVKEAADTLQQSTDTKIEQRKQNAIDAKQFRAAQEDGRILVKLPVEKVETSALPRDRIDLEAVAKSEEMEELMASIAARGQREPIEVYREPDGTYQLVKGWRRLTALKQLLAKSGNEDFATVTARVSVADEDRVALYIDMVEENVIREDLSFAEMAQMALTAAADANAGLEGPEAAVARLYGSLHKMKRSYIRSFVFLLEEVGDVLGWPKSVSRNIGVDVARKLKVDNDGLPFLRAALEACGTAEEQGAVLAGFLAHKDPKPNAPKTKAPKQKFEFHMGDSKITARNGELRLVAERDFTSIPKADLERAIKAFNNALD